MTNGMCRSLAGAHRLRGAGARPAAGGHAPHHARAPGYSQPRLSAQYPRMAGSDRCLHPAEPSRGILQFSAGGWRHGLAEHHLRHLRLQ